MTRRIWLGILALLFIGLGLIRLLAPAYGSAIGIAIFRALDRTSWDDEVAASSIPISHLLLWPWHLAAEQQIFNAIVAEDSPNDLLAFKAAMNLSKDLPREKARALFLNQARALPESKGYLLVSLLPLAAKGKLCANDTQLDEVIDAYRFAGWPEQRAGESTAPESRAAFARLLRACSGTPLRR